MLRWWQHPDIAVREIWGVTPDAWQDEALIAFPSSPRLALKACKGPGKTTVLAWIGWIFLLTRPHCMCGATSITGDNLKANLWTELARWYSKSELLQHVFNMTNTEIVSKQFPKTWKMEARKWARDADASQIGNALAGIHADYVLWLLDESGDYPDAIMPTAEGIFSGSPKEAHIVQAGNPTKLSGPLYRACTVARALWKVIEITGDPDDPKRSPRIPLEHAREQIQQYGRDNPWVLVNIFGQFPPSSLNALIGPDEVREAMTRKLRLSDVSHLPKILGVDVAREGDDASVVFPRQGLVGYAPLMARGLDGPQGAGMVARKWTEWGVDACFIDDTGGFGSSWIDSLRQLGYNPIGIHFAESSSSGRYANKRAEMYFEMVQWIKAGGCLPDIPELLAALTQTTYTFRGDKLLLEPKEDIKVKLGYSPDHADALALTFAQPVAMVTTAANSPKGSYQSAYDPMASMYGDEPKPKTPSSWIPGQNR